MEEEFLRLVNLSIAKKTSFAYEGHFTGRGAWKVPERFKSEGFEIHLIFCGLNTVIRSIQRVDLRVKKGGFHVTPLAIENNYFGNMEMLDKNFGMFDSVELIDTSGLIIPIAELVFGKVRTSIDPNVIPGWLIKGMPVIYQKLIAFNQCD